MCIYYKEHGPRHLRTLPSGVIIYQSLDLSAGLAGIGVIVDNGFAGWKVDLDQPPVRALHVAAAAAERRLIGRVERSRLYSSLYVKNEDATHLFSAGILQKYSKGYC